MKKKLMSILPFAIMPVFIPVYNVLDSLIFVDVFGCGCVPDAQTNMLNIPFNANDLRRIVFFLLMITLIVWSIMLSRKFKNKTISTVYCAAAFVCNLLLALWAIKSFMWA